MNARKMKQSSILGIGEIPSHWTTKNIGYLFSERTQCSLPNEDWELLSVSEYYGVAPKKEKISTDDFLTRAESLVGYKICQPGDLVSNIMLTWKGALGVTNYRGIVSPAYCVYRPNEQIVPRYVHYLFRTKAYTTLFKAYSTGIIESRLRLYTDKFFKLQCVLPPKNEQIAIANFLDSKCAEIDALTADIEKQIETLQEYKKSVITEAVTKGLDPNVEMKDSGVEWIGFIPNSWKLSRIKYGTNKIGSGKTPKGGAETYVDEGIAFLRSQNVYETGLVLDDVAYITPVTHELMASSKVKPLDVLLNITGGSIGRCCVVPESFLEANVNQHVCIIRADKCLPDWIKFFWNSIPGQYSISRLQGSANREALNFEEIANTYLPIPPLPEQQLIVTFLKKKSEQIEITMLEKQKMLDILSNYKQSLIYEYVTGKKTVPNA